MRRFSNVVALALPVTHTVTKAQASTAGRLRQLGGFAAVIVIFIYFGMRVALAVDTTNFNPLFSVPIGNDTAVFGYGASNAGALVGEVDDKDGGSHGYYLADGTATAFDCPGATHTFAEGVNGGNVIVGNCFDPTNRWQAFLIAQGRFITFKYPNSADTIAAAINNQEVMVGFFRNAAGNWGGWWSSNGRFGTVLYPGAIQTYAYAINDANAICGSASGNDGHQFGYFATNQGYIPFVVPGATDTVCTGISDDNRLVGYYVWTDGSLHSFVLDSGGFTFIDVPFQGARDTIINSIMPDGVSLVGQYTSGNTTYGFFTGSAGWPVNPEISPTLAGKSFIGAASLPLKGITYAITLTFYASGNVGFLVNITQPSNEGPLCVQDDTYNYSSGSFYVQNARLHLNNLQGEHTHTDSCNPALNTPPYPIGPDAYNFQWEVGIASDGTTRLLLTDTGLSSPLDNLLLMKY